MNNNRFPLYVVVIVVGGGLALWAGISPFLLLVLLACPLMMFFMMRGGMHGDAHGGHGGSDSPHSTQQGSQPTRAADLNNSPDRGDRI